MSLPLRTRVFGVLEHATSTPIEQVDDFPARRATRLRLQRSPIGRWLFGTHDPRVVTDSRTVDVAGRPCRMIVHRAVPSDDPALAPIVLNLHGGGWVQGNPEQSAWFASRIAAETGAVVVSPDYRLAPEHPFPAAVDDTHALLAWVFEHAAELHGDPERIAVMGDSAGGGLAATAALMSVLDRRPGPGTPAGAPSPIADASRGTSRSDAVSDRRPEPGRPAVPSRRPGPGTPAGASSPVADASSGASRAKAELPRVVAQVLLYPGVEAYDRWPAEDEFADAAVLTSANMRAFIRLYLGESYGTRDWRASPIRAESHEGAAPAFIAVADHDPLADHGRRYAATLRAAGVETTVREYSAWHGFVSLPGVHPAAADAVRDVSAFLRDRFRTL